MCRLIRRLAVKSSDESAADNNKKQRCFGVGQVEDILFWPELKKYIKTPDDSRKRAGIKTQWSHISRFLYM